MLCIYSEERNVRRLWSVLRNTPSVDSGQQSRLKQGSANMFREGPDDKYFGLCALMVYVMNTQLMKAAIENSNIMSVALFQ